MEGFLVDIKLVMCDLDGTLLTEDKTVTPLSQKTIAKLKKKGIAFGIATGRPTESVLRTLQSQQILPFVDVVVTNNGVTWLDRSDNVESETYTLKMQSAIEIFNHLKSLNVSFAIYDQRYLYTNKINDGIERLLGFHHLEPFICDIEEVNKSEIHKFILSIDEHGMAELEELAKLLPTVDYHGFKTQADLFEFVDRRVSKALAIERYVKKHGYGIEQVMAFGDTSNDIAMLREVGVGVWMANGTEDARIVSKDFAFSNEEDGVARYLISHFGLI
jgi:Cof subfamily protein (haloacid dehalogenase superfamily)